MILTYFIIGFLFGALAMYGYIHRSGANDAQGHGCAELERELARVRKELEEDERDITSAGSLEEINVRRQQRKDERKVRIMNLFDQKEEITNRDVAEVLDVSHATAHNYFEELEKEGAIQQVGSTGRSVVYKKQ